VGRTDHDASDRLTTGSWRAGCGGSRTSGSGSGPGKRANGDAGTAPWFDSTNRMLAIEGATVRSVTFASEGIVVGLRRRARRLTCPSCGWSTAASYDRSVRRWRHGDAGSSKVWLEAEIRRLACRGCGKVVTEQVEWARHGARHSRDLQDVIAWLAQRADKDTVRRLLRISWAAVRNAVTSVVVEQLDDTRLDNLFRIGVDEIAYRKGHRYLTIVADHDRDDAVVWVGEGRDGASGKDAATLGRFYAQLGEQRCKQAQGGHPRPRRRVRQGHPTTRIPGGPGRRSVPRDRGAPRGAMCSGSGARPDPLVCRSRPVKLEAV
jgi:RNase P subunit RPR2